MRMMDPANTPLGRMLLDEITPAVMVLRTPMVEDSCRKNGLSLIEMLTPFCNFSNIDVPVRTASDQPYRLRKFKLRLFYSDEIRQPNIEVTKERLKQIITHAGDKDISELCSDPPEIEPLIATSEQEFVSSWFPVFNKELSLPRLEGVIHDSPKTLYAGDLRRLTLELRNPSKVSVKNLKMRVSHPRFLCLADQEIMNLEFPTCIRKQASSSKSFTQVDVAKSANSIFVFPETTAISWEKPLMWPLWFRAADAGSISLYITIYYEMEDESTIITYRTLRMHYNLEVLPSLEVSFQTSPCPSRLQEFLVRMDVINRTNSQSFHVNQLSCVGDQWHLALLQPVESICPLEFLMAGQALSCFFKMKKHRTQGSTKDNISSLAMSGRADVRLGDGDSRLLFDTSISPLIIFHHHERLHQERQEKEHVSTVDFILLSESQYERDAGLPRTNGVFSHHTCHCRIANTSPMWWLINSPRSVSHDFSAAFCEINLIMTVYNSSEYPCICFHQHPRFYTFGCFSFWK